jgi:hypothetical protein
VAIIAPTIEVYFDGVNPTDITEYGYAVSFTRGRTRELDDVAAGVCTVNLRNHTGRFVPYDVAIEGTELLEEDGTSLLEESGSQLLEESSSAFAANIAPGKRVRIKVGAVVVFDGILDDWNYKYTPDGQADADFEAVDAFGDIARKTFDEWTASASQRAGARITAALARSEVAYAGSTSLSSGVETLQADTIAAGTNALDYIKTVARTDSGVLFASRTGVLTFLDRGSLANPTPAVEFIDNGSSVKFSGIAPGFGRELLFNRVRVTIQGGDPVTADDAASQGVYGIRTLDRSGMLFEYDWQSTNMASYLVALYANPKTRVEQLTVILDSLPTADRAGVLELDIGDCISVEWTPLGLTSSVEQELIIEGIAHSVAYDSPYVIEFQLSQPTQTDAFILDSADFGVLDVNRLSF